MRDFTICIGTTFVFGRDAETKVGDQAIHWHESFNTEK